MWVEELSCKLGYPNPSVRDTLPQSWFHAQMGIASMERVRVFFFQLNSVQFSLSVMSDCLWPHGLQHARVSVHVQLPEPTQTHVHIISDAIQPSYPLSSLSPRTFNLSQHQGLFQEDSTSHQVAKVLEFLQILRTETKWEKKDDSFFFTIPVSFPSFQPAKDTRLGNHWWSSV